MKEIDYTVEAQRTPLILNRFQVRRQSQISTMKVSATILRIRGAM